MPKVNCPHCGGQVLNEDRLAGQVVACPNCKKPFQMPAANALAHFSFEQDAAASARAAQGGAPTTDAEPWYFGFLAKHTVTAMWIGLTVLGLAALGTMVCLVITLGRGGAASYTILAFVVSLSLLVLMGLGIVFGVALVFLAVEAGRNLREIRRNTTKKV